MHKHRHVHMHTGTQFQHIYAQPYSRAYRMDSFHSLTQAKRAMMRLCRCSFRLGLQWTYRTRWRIDLAVTCGVLCAVFTTFMAKEDQNICPTHRWCMIYLKQQNPWCTESMSIYGVYTYGHVFPRSLDWENKKKLQ